MLEVKTMGLNLKNPVIVSAGPWTRGHKKIKAALESGAAAVVTESIVAEPYPDVSPRYAYDGRGLQNIRMYSGLNMDGWLKEFETIREADRFGQDGLIIANIMASTSSELAYLAKKFENAGADALELGIACPMGEGLEIIAGNADKAYDFTKSAVEASDIPVMVKLTQSVNNLPEVVSAIAEAGASGITAIDTVRCILSIDIDSGKPSLPTYGGYSGGPIRPMGLAIVAGVAQCTDLPVFGIGGIENYRHVVEYMMLGASACEVGTSVMVNGYGLVEDILSDLEAWMASHGIDDLAAIRGSSLPELLSFEEIKVEPNVAYLKEQCARTDCKRCVPCCLDNAVTVEGDQIEIDEEMCTGCALCVGICPDNIIGFQWSDV